MIQILLLPAGPDEMLVQVHHAGLQGGWLQVLKILGAAVQVATDQASKPASSIIQPPLGLLG